MPTLHSTEATMPETQNPRTVQASGPPTTDTARALIAIVSVTLLGSFFLPWINFLGVDLSGFNLQKLSDASRMFWAIPFLALCTAILTLANAGLSFTRYLAALSTYVILGIAMSQHGPELVQHLGYGAWLALISSAVLVFIPSPRRQQKKA